ncbi:MAG: phosphopantetheine-binding protein [Isosphaeraceae bacterium]|nr:phosphopantetheine-binding protein [Isosphaeraceae bacterium]
MPHFSGEIAAIISRLRRFFGRGEPLPTDRRVSFSSSAATGLSQFEHPPGDPIAGTEAARLTAPRTPVEEVLFDLWADVLRREDFGIHDRFFTLGGNSLAATRVAARVREHLGVEVPLRLFFEANTIADFAAALAADPRQGEHASRAAEALLHAARLTDQEARDWLTTHGERPSEAGP